MRFVDVKVGQTFELNGQQYTKLEKGKYRKWGRGGKTANAQPKESPYPVLIGDLVEVKVND
jgi:hypothetical protein